MTKLNLADVRTDVILHSDYVKQRVTQSLQSALGVSRASRLIQFIAAHDNMIQISGSFILAALSNAEWRARDIDIVISTTTKSLSSLIAIIEKSEDDGDCNSGEYRKIRKASSYEGLVVHHLQGKNKTSIDLILMNGMDMISKIKNVFDFDICMCGFNGHYVWSAINVNNAVACFNPQRCQTLTRAINRCRKYKGRGMKISCPGHDANHLADGSFVCSGCFTKFIATISWIPDEFQTQCMATIVFQYAHIFDIDCNCYHCRSCDPVWDQYGVCQWCQ